MDINVATRLLKSGIFSLSAFLNSPSTRDVKLSVQPKQCEYSEPREPFTRKPYLLYPSSRGMITQAPCSVFKIPLRKLCMSTGHLNIAALNDLPKDPGVGIV